jgi:hypothetical protein
MNCGLGSHDLWRSMKHPARIDQSSLKTEFSCHARGPFHVGNRAYKHVDK